MLALGAFKLGPAPLPVIPTEDETWVVSLPAEAREEERPLCDPSSDFVENV